MPELLATYRRLVELAGGSDQIARFLSLYCPTPYIAGCSQAVWTRGEPFLIRNYDFHPALWEATVLHTCWNGRRVVSMCDCLWGALDGMNDAGLAVSLAFGGREIVGDGFGVALILRYILEFCESSSEAVAVLRRIPCHMAYNVTVLDKTGQYATVFISPDRSPVVLKRAIATNHQGSIDWPEHALATASVDREHVMSARLHDEQETRERFASRFLEPPLFQGWQRQAWKTLYTATLLPDDSDRRVLLADTTGRIRIGPVS